MTYWAAPMLLAKFCHSVLAWLSMKSRSQPCRSEETAGPETWTLRKVREAPETTRKFMTAPFMTPSIPLKEMPFERTWTTSMRPAWGKPAVKTAAPTPFFGPLTQNLEPHVPLFITVQARVTVVDVSERIRTRELGREVVEREHFAQLGLDALPDVVLLELVAVPRSAVLVGAAGVGAKGCVGVGGGHGLRRHSTGQKDARRERGDSCNSQRIRWRYGPGVCVARMNTTSSQGDWLALAAVSQWFRSGAWNGLSRAAR